MTTRAMFLRVLAGAAMAGRAAATVPSILVDCDFRGGDITVRGVEGDTIMVERDRRDTWGDWFYYYFRVRGAAGRTMTVKFRGPNPIASRGPAVSNDEGRTWQWLGAAAVSGPSFRYSFPAGAPETRFCLAMPYLESNFRSLMARHRGSAALRVESLCRTNKGRDTELLRLGRLDGKCGQRVLITARHHACEMMASHTLDGLIEEILSASPDGRWLRKHVEFMVIPFVDKDGVEDGDPGRYRGPWDHYVDYAGESIYPTVAALRKKVPEWSGGRLRFALEMQCTGRVGRCDEIIHAFGAAPYGSDPERDRFGKMIEAVQKGPLRFRNEDYGPCVEVARKGWQPRYASPRRNFCEWAQELPGVRLASGIAIPYATASGEEVTVAGARGFGHDLARAIRRYLQETAS